MRELGKVISDNNECLKWSSICHPMKGEEICGDDFLIVKGENKVLVAVVDGLGHGKEALEASGRALDCLSYYKDESLISLMTQCHEKLKETRGVVMSMAIFDPSEDSMSWMGVGNVEGILFRVSENGETPKETILLRGGVVGYKLPQLKASIITIEPGDTLVFTTDGVNYGYSNTLDTNLSTNDMVMFISDNYVDHADDAQILVARYRDD